MAIGYIKYWRSSQENELYFADPFTHWQAWTDLLILAAYKDTTVFVRGIAVHLKPGDVLAGEDFLASRWKWSRGKVRRFLSYLESKTVQQTVQQKTNVCTVVSILNWSAYQGNGTADGTANSTTDSTANSTTDGHTKEVEEVKEIEEVIPDFSLSIELGEKKPEPATGKTQRSPRKKDDEYDSDFVEFWKVYPISRGKDDAYRKYLAAKKNGAAASVILEAIKAQVAAKHFLRSDGKEFIPNPATWLYQGRWKDVIKQSYISEKNPSYVTECIIVDGKRSFQKYKSHEEAKETLVPQGYEFDTNKGEWRKA
ncbi:MAG: hypothetical protein WC455_08980 [Dehalococcoidia bacterium]|jgi:hypothetical protein